MKTSNIQTSHNHAIIKGWVDGSTLTDDGASGVVSGEYENASGGDFELGDVVALAADGSIVLADVANDPRPIGVALDDVGDGTFGPIAWSGPVPRINVTASVTNGEYAETTTTPGQAASVAARSGTSFGYFTSSGTSPSGFLFGGGGGTSVSALDDLSDVAVVTPVTAQRLRYNGTSWVNSSLIWRPLTVFDPTTSLWVPLVDGSGNAIMAEA